MKNKGFTLIELIVSMAVFLFIIGAAIGIFISIIQHQEHILKEQQLLNQTSYAEEYMSKAMRMAVKQPAVETPPIGSCLTDYSASSSDSHTGYSYLLTRPIGGNYTGIKFLNQSNEATYTDGKKYPVCEEFYVDNGQLKEIKTYYPYNQSTGSAYDSQAVLLTSSSISIISIKFGIDGYNGGSGSGLPIGDQQDANPDIRSFQPRVTVSMQITIPGETRTIQTTVSQRNLNINPTP